MKYIRVTWKHSSANYPRWLFSELNDSGWEIRKVEIWPDNSRGYASETNSSAPTRLGLEPIPSLQSIAADPQFEPEEISKEEFERIWSGREGEPNTQKAE